MQRANTVGEITSGVIWKQLLFFFFPILLGTFFQQMYNTVDTVIVGRFVGTQALAAVGATSALITGVCVCLFRVVWIFTMVRRFHVVEMLAVCYPLSWVLASAVFLGVYLRGGWLPRRGTEGSGKPQRS